MRTPPRSFWTGIGIAALVALGFPPMGVWPSTLVGLAWMGLEFLEELTPRSAAWLLGSYTFFVNIFGFYWIAYTLKEFGGMSWVVSVPVTLLGFLLFSIMPSLFAAALARWAPRARPSLRSLLWRGTVITGALILLDTLDLRLFPWSPAMSVGSNSLLLASVHALGTGGWRLIFFTSAMGLALAYRSLVVLQKKSLALVSLGFSVAILGAAFVVGSREMKQLKTRYAERQPIALIQGNVGNYEKKLTKLGVMPTIRNVLKIHRDLIEEVSIELADAVADHQEPWVLWPETSFPGFPVERLEDRRIIEDWARLTRGLHLVGAYQEAPFTFAGRTSNLDFNIVALFHEKTGLSGYYQKMIRVPFGEYIPGDEWLPQLYDWLPAVNHFGKGLTHEAIPHPDPQGPVFVPVVCYEILFASFVDDFVAAARKKYSSRALVIVNPTNDSWYGPTSEPFLHAHLARWAAARQGLALLRPTNTGLSMIIAPWGEVLAQGPRNEASVIYGDLPVERTQRRE